MSIAKIYKQNISAVSLRSPIRDALDRSADVNVRCEDGTKKKSRKRRYGSRVNRRVKILPNDPNDRDESVALVETPSYRLALFFAPVPPNSGNFGEIRFPRTRARVDRSSPRFRTCKSRDISRRTDKRTQILTVLANIIARRLAITITRGRISPLLPGTLVRFSLCARTSKAETPKKRCVAFSRYIYIYSRWIFALRRRVNVNAKGRAAIIFLGAVRTKKYRTRSSRERHRLCNSIASGWRYAATLRHYACLDRDSESERSDPRGRERPKYTHASHRTDARGDVDAIGGKEREKIEEKRETISPPCTREAKRVSATGRLRRSAPPLAQGGHSRLETKDGERLLARPLFFFRGTLSELRARRVVIPGVFCESSTRRVSANFVFARCRAFLRAFFFLRLLFLPLERTLVGTHARSRERQRFNVRIRTYIYVCMYARRTSKGQNGRSAVDAIE